MGGERRRSCSGKVFGDVRMKKSSASRIRRSLNNSLKRLFVTDYHVLRNAGLTRVQAFKICKERYAKAA